MGTPDAFLPILLMFTAAAILGAALLFLNGVMGRKVRTLRKLGPYESGMPLLDDSRKRISVKFFIVAMVFILFDVEVILMCPWAVAARKLGVFGLIEMAIFLVILLVGFVYAWKNNAFKWQ